MKQKQIKRVVVDTGKPHGLTICRQALNNRLASFLDLVIGGDYEEFFLWSRKSTRWISNNTRSSILLYWKVSILISNFMIGFWWICKDDSEYCWEWFFCCSNFLYVQRWVKVGEMVQKQGEDKVRLSPIWFLPAKQEWALEEEFTNHMMRFHQVTVSFSYFNKLHFDIPGWIDSQCSSFQRRKGRWWSRTPENGTFLFPPRAVAWWTSPVSHLPPDWDYHPPKKKIQDRHCNVATGGAKCEPD